MFRLEDSIALITDNNKTCWPTATINYAFELLKNVRSYHCRIILTMNVKQIIKPLGIFSISNLSQSCKDLHYSLCQCTSLFLFSAQFASNWPHLFCKLTVNQPARRISASRVAGYCCSHCPPPNANTENTTMTLNLIKGFEFLLNSRVQAVYQLCAIFGHLYEANTMAGISQIALHL